MLADEALSAAAATRKKREKTAKDGFFVQDLIC